MSTISITEFKQAHFILEGFDKIVAEKGATLENQILDWANRNPEVPTVPSGHTDDRFSSWQQFSTFHVLPFDEEQPCRLIR